MEGRLIDKVDTKLDEHSTELSENTSPVSSSLYSEELRMILPTECFFASWNVFQKYFLSVCKPLKRPLQAASEGLNPRVSLNCLEMLPFNADLSASKKEHQSLYTRSTTEKNPDCSHYYDEKNTVASSATTPTSELESNSMIAPISMSESTNNSNIMDTVVNGYHVEHDAKSNTDIDKYTAAEHKPGPFASPKRHENTYKASTRIIWTKEMNDLFVSAYNSIIGEVPTPVRILRFMGSSYPNLTQKHVQSKLQKYRLQNNLKASVSYQCAPNSRLQTQRQQRQRKYEARSIDAFPTHLKDASFSEIKSITAQPLNSPAKDFICMTDATKTSKVDSRYP